VKNIAEPGETFVVCEATGGYERTLVKAIQTACVPKKNSKLHYFESVS